MAYVAGGEDARSAGFLRQRRSVQWPMTEILAGQEEALGVAFDGVGQPIGVRVGTDQHEQPVGGLNLFAAGCGVTHRNGFQTAMAVYAGYRRVVPDANIGRSLD